MTISLAAVRNILTKTTLWMSDHLIGQGDDLENWEVQPIESHPRLEMPKRPYVG